MSGMGADVWIALGVGAFVLVLFLVALLVPRTTRPAPSTEHKLDDVKARIDEIEKKQEKADHDLRNVRATVQALATKDHVNRVEVQVAEMRGDLRGLAKDTSSTNRSIERIEDFLMRSTADLIANAKASETKS